MAMPSAWCWPHMPGQCYCYSALKPLLVGVKPEREHSAVALRQQTGVAADGCRVDGPGPLGYESQQIVWATGFRARAGKPHTTKGLHTHDRADHVAVYVNIADPDAALDRGGQAFVAALDAEGKAVAATIDAVDHLIHVGRLITDDVQNGTEVFLIQFFDTLETQRRRADELADRKQPLRDSSLRQ